MAATKPAEQTAESPDRLIQAVVGIALVVLVGMVAVFNFGLLDGDSSSDTVRDYQSELLTIIGEDSPASPPGAGFPHIVYNDGVLFVRGVASSEDLVDETIAELEPLFGEGNVIPEIVIDSNFQEDPDASTSVFFSEVVLFESGSAVVAPEFLDVLGASVAFLQLTPDTTIEITGHTDTDGDPESNLALSQARVDAARAAMIERGGDPDRITAVGKGETEPIADNSTEEGRQLNRRVELTIGSSS